MELIGMAILVKDFEILMNHKYNLKLRVSWSADELTFLVHGVSKYGNKWKLLYTEYKTHFHESRSRIDLNWKYFHLKRAKTFIFSTKSIIIVH